MPNIARPSVRPSAAKTKIVLVQSAGPAARQVKRIEEPDRTPLRLAIGVITTLGIAGLVWMMGHLGYSLGFAPLARVPELATSSGGEGFATGTMMLISIPEVVFRAGFTKPEALMLGFVLIAIPAAALSAAKPRVKGGPRLSRAAMTYGALGAIAAGLNSIALVWWTTSQYRSELVRELPWLPRDGAAWLADLQIAAGLDVLAVVAGALWVVLSLRLPTPLWLRALSATAAFFALVVSAVALSMSLGAVSHIRAPRAVCFIDNDEGGPRLPYLLIGHTQHQVALLQITEHAAAISVSPPPTGESRPTIATEPAKTTDVKLIVHPESMTVIGRQSIISLLNEAARRE